MRHTGGVAHVVDDDCELRVLTRDSARCIVDGARLVDWCADYPSEGDIVIAGLLLATDEPTVEPWCSFQVVWHGTVVGGVGAKSPPRDGVVEIGYGLAPSARGRGIAARAVALLMSSMRAEVPTLVVEAQIDQANRASIALVTQLGFTSAGVRDGLVLFRHHPQAPTPP